MRVIVLRWIDAVRSLPMHAGWDPLTERRIIRQLLDAGATSPETAQPFRAHTRYEAAVFLHLVRGGVVREPTRGRYYVDVRAVERR